MHLPDGMLPGEICIAGYAGTAALTWFAVRRTERGCGDTSRIVSRASVLAAAFFVVSWIHIPIPPVSVHPLLAGLMGVLLGWLSFPAILVGLFFQAAMFGHGGFTTLGVNAMTMGIPALLAWVLYRSLTGRNGSRRVLLGGFIAGFIGVMLAAGFTAALLLLTIPSYMDAGAERAGIIAMLAAHLPLAVAEGVFTGLVVEFLSRVSPGMLDANG